MLGMRRHDYFGQGSRGWLRFHEKGGKRHDVPAHHRAAAALHAYVEAAGIEKPKAALFQTTSANSAKSVVMTSSGCPACPPPGCSP